MKLTSRLAIHYEWPTTRCRPLTYIMGDDEINNITIKGPGVYVFGAAWFEAQTYYYHDEKRRYFCLSFIGINLFIRRSGR